MAYTPYVPQVHDEHHTMDRRLFLLAQQSRKVWELWCQLPLDHPLRQMGSDMQIQMAQLYNEIRATDIFMGGWVQGQRENS